MGLPHVSFVLSWGDIYGNATLTRLTPATPDNSMNKLHLGDGRWAHWVDVDVPIGMRLLLNCDIILGNKTKRISFVNAHLDHLDEAKRLEELYVWEKAVASGAVSPHHILMGDFNSLWRKDYDDKKWSQIEKKRLHYGYVCALCVVMVSIERPKNDAMTFLFNRMRYRDMWSSDQQDSYPTCVHGTRIDYILSRGMEDWDVVECKRLTDVTCSDHTPVWIKIRPRDS